MMRRLPYGANYLDLGEMTELREAIRERILFRYQTIVRSAGDRFEERCRAEFGARHALAVHNCTEAIRLALIASRPSVGDVVYVPAVTFVAVAGAVLSCGMVPVLVDVDEDLRFDPGAVPAGARRAIVAHMEGTVSPLPAHVPFVIEDCAQAMGARHSDGRPVGTAGTAGVFSFHHNKVLTSGEGGLVLTGDDELYARMRSYHDHGATRVQGEYPTWRAGAFYGENLVASEVQTAVQIQQVRHLGEIRSGLERGYAAMAAAIGDVPDVRVRRRAAGDVKISIIVEFECTERRRCAEAALRAAGLPFWTLDKYFLPDHPVVRDRQSPYADGFPWNLAPPPADPAAFERTRERIARRLCISIAPEATALEQECDAEVAAAALRSLPVPAEALA